MHGTYATSLARRLHYYRCDRRGKYEHIAECKERGIRVDFLDDLVWNRLVKMFDEDIDEGIGEMIRQSEAETRPTKERIVILDDAIAKADDKIARLVKAFSEENNPDIRKAVEKEMRYTADLKASQEREREGLQGRLAQNEFSEERQQRIRDLARQFRQRLPKGSFEGKREVLDALDVEIQVCYNEEGQRQLKISCTLGEDLVLCEYSSESSIPPGGSPSSNTVTLTPR